MVFLLWQVLDFLHNMPLRDEHVNQGVATALDVRSSLFVFVLFNLFVVSCVCFPSVFIHSRRELILLTDIFAHEPASAAGFHSALGARVAHSRTENTHCATTATANLAFKARYSSGYSTLLFLCD